MANKKQKTCKSVSKRVKLSSNGKIIRRKSCKNHRITGKWKTVRQDKSWLNVEWWMLIKAKKMLGM